MARNTGSLYELTVLSAAPAERQQEKGTSCNQKELNSSNKNELRSEPPSLRQPPDKPHLAATLIPAFCRYAPLFEKLMLRHFVFTNDLLGWSKSNCSLKG